MVTRFTNADLPAGCLDQDQWQCVFLPTHLQYLASRDTDNTWIIKDKDAVLLMQCVWDYIYGASILYMVNVGEPVFFIVSYSSFLFH